MSMNDLTDEIIGAAIEAHKAFGRGLMESVYGKCLCHEFDLKRIHYIDYCFSSVTTLSRGIWMSFFDTEEAHAGMLAHAADRGGRATLKVTSTSLHLNVCSGDGRPPGSSGKNKLKAPA